MTELEQLASRFPAGTTVKLCGGAETKGEVRGLNRCYITGAPLVMVRWDATGITASCRPSDIEPASISSSQ